MTQQPNHLRVFDEASASPAGVPAPLMHRARNERKQTLARAFALATGWQFDDAVAARSTALASASGNPIQPAAEFATRLPLEQAASLAKALEGLTADLDLSEQTLCQREAELATMVPLVRPRGESQLAQRWEASLRAVAESTGCVAAGLYLLDDVTTGLNLRVSWNLPLERFTAGPRPLATALADLEALCGHAVAIEDSQCDPTWNPPEAFPAFVCVPVASAQIPLGTLWFFADRAREFSDHDVHLIEVLAGRLAAELERESVIAGQQANAMNTRELDQAQRLQQNQLPRVAPFIENWSVAGWTSQAPALGGSFHDWMTTADDRLLLTAAQALEGGLAGALVAANLRAAWRAHGQYHPAPAKLLQRLNHALWTGSAGDQYASLVTALVDPANGRLLLATAGPCLALLISEQGCEALVETSLAAGRQPTGTYAACQRQMAPGDVLLLASGTNFDLAARPAAAAIQELSQAMRQTRNRGADWLVELARTHLSAKSENPAHEISILVVQQGAGRNCN